MFKIIQNSEVGPSIFHLILNYDQLSEQPEPGQFFNLKVSQNGSNDPLLRRPLSIFDFREVEQKVEFIYRVVGKGTKLLSKMNSGEEIDILGPLGSGFSLDKKHDKLDLIGGGMGIVPLYYLAKKLKAEDISVYLGAAKREELGFFENKFLELGLDTHLAAMEEKLEIQGTALELWLNYFEQQRPDFVYTCGPEKMLKAVEKECLENKIKGQLSVEKRMGCGIGVCLSCSCETRDKDQKNKRACVEGPVFELGEVILDG